MGINIGSFTATLLCGWLGETFGWKYGFGAAGIGMIVGLFTFMYGQRVPARPRRAVRPGEAEEGSSGPSMSSGRSTCSACRCCFVLWWLVQREHVVLMGQNIFLIIDRQPDPVLDDSLEARRRTTTAGFRRSPESPCSRAYSPCSRICIRSGGWPTYADTTIMGCRSALIVGFVVYGFRHPLLRGVRPHGRADDPDPVDDRLLGAVRTVGGLDDAVRGPRRRPQPRQRDVHGRAVRLAERRLHHAARDPVRDAVDLACEEESRAVDAGEIRARHNPGRARLRRPRASARSSRIRPARWR